MRRLFKPIFWTFLFLIMMLGIDQFLVQVPPIHPAQAAVCNFYRDFRGRLIELTLGEKRAPAKTIEAVIARQQEKTAPTTAANAESRVSEGNDSPAPKPTQRYLYSDDQGNLQFVDSLEEIPEKYRPEAQPMAQ